MNLISQWNNSSANASNWNENINPITIEALKNAIAIPNFYTKAELIRTLLRNNYDVMKSALQLREKHTFLHENNYLSLDISLTTIQMELHKGYVHILEDVVDLYGCPIVLLQLQHYKPSFNIEKTQLMKQGGTKDGTSSLVDTRQLCIYILDVMVDIMEEKQATGVTFIIDLQDTSLVNLDSQMATDLLLLVKKWYPNIVKNILVMNGNHITNALTKLIMQLASQNTQQHIRILQSMHELRNFIPPASIPICYGGSYVLRRPMEWIKTQAEIEEVDLNIPATEEEKQYMTSEAQQLNGMQYAGVSVDEVTRMKATTIRGAMYRHTGKSGIFTSAWATMYALLRPDALLLYTSVNGKNPALIIPITEESSISVATVVDGPKNAAGFRIIVPGVIGGHLLALNSEEERGNWMQEIQLEIDAIQKLHQEKLKKWEREEREEKSFAELNMISFDECTPVIAAPSQSTPNNSLLDLPNSNAALGSMQQFGPSQVFPMNNGQPMLSGASQQYQQYITMNKSIPYPQQFTHQLGQPPQSVYNPMQRHHYQAMSLPSPMTSNQYNQHQSLGLQGGQQYGQYPQNNMNQWPPATGSL